MGGVVMGGRKRIAVLTGGGDVPGLNVAIKAVVARADSRDIEVVGIRRGWMGLLCIDPGSPETAQSLVMPLTLDKVRTIDRTGGTILHTSRTNPGNVNADEVPPFVEEGDRVPTASGRIDCTRHILKVLESLAIDAIIPIGGDDTLSYAVRLHKEGVQVVAIPKTMDNDVFGTDFCIGFSTAVTRSVDAINALRTTTGSHERICVVELFGRNSGETSLIAAYLADVDRAVISEVPFDLDKLVGFLVTDRSRNPSNYAIMTISEGAHTVGGTVTETGIEMPTATRSLAGWGTSFPRRSSSARV